ncbi:MAG TPA: flagellar biosynthesis anti-sigma factor FlgM [Candidatus Jeotgalibaca pullicola]|nr:flagellar biosynthesis anti-sigma factor FlgM [Candidatus Jeotgalibaca pullicola]
MKITNGHQHYLRNVRNTQNLSAESQKQSIKKTSNQEYVSVEISDEAKKLSEAKMSIASTEKIEAIKKAIQDGSYQVSTEKIANGIVDTMAAQKKGNR